MIERLRRAIQPEDLLLAAVLVAVPLLAGGSAASSSGFFDDQVDVLAGLFAILGAIGAIVCIATRPPGASPIDPARASTSGAGRQVDLDARLALIGPYIGGVALVGAHGFEKLGIRGGDWLAGPAFIAAVVAVVLADRLPVVRPEWRRLLVTPFVLVAGGIFQGLVAGITRGLDLRALTEGLPGLGFAIFVYGLLIAGTAVFYTMLVFAPRELAASEPERGRWLVRFGLFLVFLVIGLWLRPSSG